MMVIVSAYLAVQAYTGSGLGFTNLGVCMSGEYLRNILLV